MLTPDEISERTSRAVQAAAAAGRDLGLRVDDPRVLYDVFSVIVHLDPSPVVVRVPTVLPPSRVGRPEAQAAQQRRELAVTAWLAGRGHPVVPPSDLVPAEPVLREGFSMTFWPFVDVLDVAPDYAARVAQTARLHAALRDYDGDLEFWTPYGAYIPDGLTALERLPDVVDRADLERAQREWSVVAPVLTSRPAFEAAFPSATVQAIHGDAPFHNMLTTPDGELWSDFELVTLGAVESDLAMVGPEALAAYDGPRRLDPAILRITDAAANLAMVSCLAMAPQLPMLIDGVAPALETWRAAPELTSL